MGCDIHLFTERKRTINNIEQWVSIDNYRKNPYYDGINEFEAEYELFSVYRSRNYQLFAMLADVRNYDDNIVISKPRGIPNDSCEEIKKEKEHWDCDGHSHSYFTVKELKDFKTKNSIIQYSGYVSKMDSKLIDEGDMPYAWSDHKYSDNLVYREWERPNDILDDLISKLEIRIRENFYLPNDADTSKYDEKVRIVFWFDN